MTKTKKTIIMGGLVLLLAVTAIFNFVLAETDAVASTDTEVAVNYFTSYRSERSSTRNEIVLQLDSIITENDVSSSEYKEAVDMKLKIIDIMEKELKLEMMVKSLGFEDAVVSIGYESDNCNVFINSVELDYDSALSIYKMLQDEADLVSGNIIIMPVYSEV